MDVIGRWFFARWLGGSCRLANTSAVDGEDGGVVFFEGKSELHLQQNTDGFWEGPKGSGLKLFRHGIYLVLHRDRRGDGNIRQVFAVTSPWAAACLCYRLTLRSMFAPAKDNLLAPTAPSAKAVANAQQSFSSNDGSSTLSEEDEFWPEPEAEGHPEQPSTAQEQNSLSLLLTLEQLSEEMPEEVSDEILSTQPQKVSYCQGVTTANHRAPHSPRVVPLGIDVVESTTKSGSDSEPTTPKSAVISEEQSAAGTGSSLSDIAAGVNLDITEEHQSADLGRAVAEVTELKIGMHGLITVPENMEIPDVPNPIAPSKSDSALLHGSVAFEGDLNSWWRENYEIPEEVAVSSRDEEKEEQQPSNERHLIELGSPLTPAAMAHLQRQEARPAQADSRQKHADDDPRDRPNPLVRSNKVSHNLTRGASREE